MKRVPLLLAALCALAVLPGCAAELPAPDPPLFAALIGPDGAYTGFSGLPETYEPGLGAWAGCWVLDYVRRESLGEEHWDAFVRASEAGEPAFIRLVKRFEEGLYFTDLYYDARHYHLFDSSDPMHRAEYPYLFDLRGRSPNAARASRQIWLTDEADLTSERASRSLFSSSTADWIRGTFVVLSVPGT